MKRPSQKTVLIMTVLATGAAGLLLKMNYADPEHPKMNRHPIKLYEITATTDAPGPWDSVSAYIGYDVVTPSCSPENKLLGVHELPTDLGRTIVMTRVGTKTWKGNFYRDLVLDENYYQLGICHWDATSVVANFVVHNEMFAAGGVMEEFLKNGTTATYFKTIDFTDRSRTAGALESLSTDPEVVQSPNAFFPITVNVTEVTP